MRISKANHVFALSKDNKPCCAVDLPASLLFETMDCFGEQICTPADTLETVDFDRVNPATGPVYCNGVHPGDALRVKVNAIEVVSPGKMLAAPEFGVLGKRVTSPEIKFIEIKDDQVVFNDAVSLPLEPMVGVIGVAPEGDGVNCGTPGDHGGNMDTKLIRPGATVYFPVFVEGALLAMGDLHAAMGDGEIMVSGVEVSGEVDVEIAKVEGLSLPMPLVKTETELSFIASDEALYKAVEKATSAMTDFIMERTDLSLNQTGMLLSACGDTQISQVVDPEKTARMTVPLSVLHDLGINTDF